MPTTPTDADRRKDALDYYVEVHKINRLMIPDSSPFLATALRFEDVNHTLAHLTYRVERLEQECAERAIAQASSWRARVALWWDHVLNG